MAKAVGIAIGGVIIILIGIGAFTLLGLQPHQQADHGEFCFAEWCIAPTSMDAGAGSTTVHALVRSDARGITQRPDHPQAWLSDAQGHEAGGPHAELDRPVGPGESFKVDLTFPVALTGCAAFVVAEGAWPPFLGLGYAPSPFTERASWRLCPGAA